MAWILGSGLFVLAGLILVLTLALHTSLQLTSAQPSQLDSGFYSCALLPPPAKLCCGPSANVCSSMALKGHRSPLVSTQWVQWLFSVASIRWSLGFPHPLTSNSPPQLKTIVTVLKLWFYFLNSKHDFMIFFFFYFYLKVSKLLFCCCCFFKYHKWFWLYV